jgi:hypothetical protein
MPKAKLECEQLFVPEDTFTEFLYKSFGFFLPIDSMTIFEGSDSDSYRSFSQKAKDHKLSFYSVQYKPVQLVYPDEVLTEFPKIIEHIKGEHSFCFIQNYVLTSDTVDQLLPKKYRSEYKGRIIHRPANGNNLPVLYEFNSWAANNHFYAFWDTNNIGYIGEKNKQSDFFELTQSDSYSDYIVHKFFDSVSWVFSMDECHTEQEDYFH